MEKQFTHHGLTHTTAHLLAQGCPTCREACSVGHCYNILLHFSPLSNPPPRSSCFSKALRSKNPLDGAVPISSNRRLTPGQGTLCLSGPQLHLRWAQGGISLSGCKHPCQRFPTEDKLALAWRKCRGQEPGALAGRQKGSPQCYPPQSRAKMGEKKVYVVLGGIYSRAPEPGLSGCVQVPINQINGQNRVQ